jgi:hypothetical protein
VVKKIYPVTSSNAPGAFGGPSRFWKKMVRKKRHLKAFLNEKYIFYYYL